MYSIKSSVKTKTSVSVSTSEQTSVKRLKLTPAELAKLATSAPQPVSSRKPTVPPPRVEFHGTGTSGTTPAPPTTPRSGPAFVCRSEGFFPHPSSCKKYYWCLDTPSQGMVAHTFSCPQGLFFNEITDGCDFLRNVNCGDKDTEEKEETKETSENIETEEEVLSEADNEEEDVEDPKSLKDILEIVKAAGGIEGLEKQIKEEEDAKKEEEDRRVRISSKTRSRLSQLLNKGQRSKTDRDPSPAPSVSSVSPRGSSASRSEASLNSLFSRLANKRRLQPGPEPDNEAQESQQRITIVGAHLAPEEPEEDPLVLGVFKPKDGVREKLRETLHNVLAVEMAERAKEVQFEETEGVTSVPNAVTISKNTRVEENRQREPSRNFVSRARKLPTSNEVSQDSNRYVTIQRGGEPTEPTFSEADTSNQSSEREEDASFEDNSSSVFRPTISDNLISIDTTPTPFFPTFSPSPTTTTTTTPLPVIVLTEEPRQRQQRPRKLEI